MKNVRNEDQRGFIPIKVNELGNGLEKISVKIGALVEKRFHRSYSDEDLRRKQQVWSKVFRKLFETTYKDEAKPADGQAKTVVINISLPNIKKLVDKFKSADNKFKVASAALAAAILFVAIQNLSGSNQQTGKQDEKDRVALIAENNKVKLEKGTPKFDTILPAGKDINDLGGWTRVSPPNRDPVYAYTDKVGSAKLAVSEQPLPEKLKTNTEAQVSKVAQNFNAYDKLTSGNTLAYIGTSEDGQSIILSKADLLILIKSSSFLSNSEWAEYINSLQ